MRGKHRVIVSTKRLKYDFEIRRNLTIIRGDSATGKTTLVDMIQEYVNNPTGSPVDLTCDKKCYVLEGALWKGQLAEITDSIVFIDEGNDFIKTEEFAREIQSKVRYYKCRNQFNFILFIILECLKNGSHIFHNGGDTKVFPKY